MMSLFDSPLGPWVADTRFTAAMHDAAVKRGEDGEEDDGTT
jgi:hypothetical protein